MGRIDNRYGTGSVLMAKGRCYLDLKRYEEAEGSLKQALHIHESLLLSRKITSNALSLARVFIEKKDAKNAREYLGVARKTATSKGYDSDLAKTALLESYVAIREGKKPDTKFQEAIRIFKSIGRDKDAKTVENEFDAYKRSLKKKPTKKKKPQPAKTAGVKKKKGATTGSGKLKRTKKTSRTATKSAKKTSSKRKRTTKKTKK